MLKHDNRYPKTRKRRILYLIAALTAAVIFSLCLFGCEGTEKDTEDEATTVCEHNFIPQASTSDRPPTYGEEGRQYMVCTKCGFSMLVTIPALELEAAENAPDYYPLLDKYVLKDVMGYDEFAEKYLPSAWSFKENPNDETAGDTDGDDTDGDGAEDNEILLTSGSYVMVFVSAHEGYKTAECTITVEIRIAV